MMSQKELTERMEVILEAMTWLCTPFHFGARVKGAGVDCAQFIAAVFETCGIFKAEDYGFFGRDWHLNTDNEHYKFRLVRHATELPASEKPNNGDILLVKVGRVFSHGGIVADLPWIIHARPQSGVIKTRIDRDPAFIGWEKLFFNPWSKHVQE